MADVTMPQLGETVTEGTITRWMKAIGEPVERDEPLFEVSTDKVDSEVPSPAAGVLLEILVPEGETVGVGTRLAVIGEKGSGEPTAKEEVASDPAPKQEANDPVPAKEDPAPAPTSVEQVEEEDSPVLDQSASKPRLLSPVVRKLLTENGLDASDIPGTGLGGRITRADVLGAIDKDRVGEDVKVTSAVRPSLIEPSAVTAPKAQSHPVASLVNSVVPFSNIRRRTAEHMVRSKATSPHAFIAGEVDFENVEKTRKAFGERFREEEGFSLTYLPFIARATVDALREYPYLNASVADDALVVHQEIGLGIAVDLHFEGLIVPVIHRAEELTIRGISRRIRDLAERARTKQLSADDISGGTFSITNDGPFGSFFTIPIINQPQVGILATDAVVRKPVVVEHADGSESIAIHSVGTLGMSWDHRAVDGAYVASFLALVRTYLAERDWSQEL